MSPNLIRNFRFEISDFRSSLLRPAALLLILATTSAFATVRYVNVNNANPASPYTGWATAAQTIQDAVDAAVTGDEIVVTNGVYASGGRAVVGTMTNRVAVYKPLKIHSVNGPGLTLIQGYQVPGTTNGDGAIRCVYLANGASLSGFTLTNGATRGGPWGADQSAAGGLWCESVSALASNCVITGNAAQDGGGVYSGQIYNCTIAGNTSVSYGGGAIGAWMYDSIIASNAAYYGGGASGGTLNNCCVVNNSARGHGGGAQFSSSSKCLFIGNAAPNGGGQASGALYDCLLIGNTAAFNGGGVVAIAGVHGTPYPATLSNCTLVGNRATNSGGGSFFCFLTNCILYFNTAPVASNYDVGSDLNYCCTTPLPPAGVGNLGKDPLFVDRDSGNLRLLSSSPCINAGDNSCVVDSLDLDGRPRIVGGTVDIGAYEFQPDTSGAFIAWLAQYGLPTDGSADYTDPDGDGRNNWQEWRCQTNPTNAASVLRMVSTLRAGANVSVTWQSVAGVNYFLERSTNLMALPPFVPLATNVSGQTGMTSYSDTGAAAMPRLYYRAGVGN